MLLLLLAGFFEISGGDKIFNASAPNSLVRIGRQSENEFDDSEKIFKLLNKGLSFLFKRCSIFNFGKVRNYQFFAKNSKKIFYITE